jgi:hypothetical protein
MEPPKRPKWASGHQRGPSSKPAPIKFGTLRGKVWIADNFDDPLPDDVVEEFNKGGGPLSMKPDK